MSSAHILINCKLGSENEVLDKLKKLETISEAQKIYGLFDIIAKLESPNIQKLQKNISTDIRKITNIISTMTLVDVNE